MRTGQPQPSGRKPPCDGSCSARHEAALAKLRTELRAAKRKIAELEARLSQSPPDFAKVNGVERRVDQFLAAHDQLTSRELEIARLFSQFASDQKVAQELGTALQTVRNQLASIQQKLGVDSRPELLLRLLSERS